MCRAFAGRLMTDRHGVSDAPMHPDISISAPRDEQIMAAGLPAVTRWMQHSRPPKPAPPRRRHAWRDAQGHRPPHGGGLLCGTWRGWMVGEKSPRALDFFPVSDVDPGRSGTGREWNMVTSRCRHERRRRLVFRPRRATVPPPRPCGPTCPRDSIPWAWLDRG